eukprot:2704870-Amphidinium_carterae.1
MPAPELQRLEEISFYSPFLKIPTACTSGTRWKDSHKLAAESDCCLASPIHMLVFGHPPYAFA